LTLRCLQLRVTGHPVWVFRTVEVSPHLGSLGLREVYRA
jgi:hypothetical protein